MLAGLRMTVAVLLLTAQAWSAPRAIVRLRSAAEVSDALVCVRDVAQVFCNDAELREAIEALDLWEFKTDDVSEAVLNRQFIELRIVLAGIEKADVSLQGNPRCNISHGVSHETVVQTAASQISRPTVAAPKLSPPKPLFAPDLPVGDDIGELLTDENLEKLVQIRVASNLQMAPDDVRVTISGTGLSQILGKDVYGQHGQVELGVSNLPNPGRITVNVRVMRHGKLVATGQTQFDLALRQKVLKAKRLLRRRAPVTEDDFEVSEEWIVRHQPRPDLSDVHDAFMTRDIGSGELLKLTDLQHPDPLQMEAKDYAVKSQDRVRVTVRGRSVTVRATEMEAQQNGKVGDYIRVKNMTSGKFISAQVVAKGEVEIAMGPESFTR